MRCEQCGHESERESKFCPECGARQDVSRSTALQDEHTETAQADDLSDPADVQISINDEDDASKQVQLHQQRLAYVRQDYDPSRDGRYRQPAPTAGQYTADPGRRPPTTGMVVFSIINMICCGLGVSLILGIIALVLSIISSSEPDYERAVRKLETARILNIIGLVFIVLQVVVLFVIIISGLIFSSNTVTHWGSFTF